MATSRSKRRAGVLVNIAGLVSFFVCFFAGDLIGWPVWLIVAMAVLMVVVVLTFVTTFWRTRLWHLVHRKSELLDERELHVVYRAVNGSYAVFSVLCLILLLVLLQFEPAVPPAGKVLLAGLIYLAHMLPAMFVAWTEREV
jgi:hypothetical protein